MSVSFVPVKMMMATIFLLWSGSAFAAKQRDFGKWDIPSNGQPYLPIDAVVGDFVTFDWVGGKFHNVYFHPNDSCAIDDTRVEIGLTSPATYTFKEEDGSPMGNTMLFTCDVTGHCNSGMQIAIRVFSTQADLDVVSGSGAGGSGLAPSPTSAPTAAAPMTPSLITSFVVMVVALVAVSFVSTA